MATTSLSNPAPIFDLPVFIPENWSVGVDTTTSSSNYSLYNLIGQITIFEGSTPPTNWVWCDGTEYPTTEYPELFGFIGYTYGGSGDNFAVPNCLGKIPYGADNTSILTATFEGSSVSSGGNRNVNPAQLATHNHNVSISPTNMVQNVSVNQSNRGESDPSGPSNFKNPIEGNANLTITAELTGNNQDMLPPFCVVKYIIRVLE